MKRYDDILTDGDLRFIEKSNGVAKNVVNQVDFDNLFTKAKSNIGRILVAMLIS